MNIQAFKQYLELLKLSGIQDIYFKNNLLKEIEPNQKNNSKISRITPNNIKNLKEKYSNCSKCKLSTSRNHFVYGNGNPNADMMLIGEGPGADEDKTGNVFVGKAGQLLTKMLKAINIERDEVYISNIIKCRPPGNRNPHNDEVEACLPYLLEQIEIISPKLILLLGRVAAISLFHIDQTLKNYRQKPLYFQGIKTYITYHPSALLRNPHWKKPAWVDLQKVRDDYKGLTKET
ncbi:MAG: uracil-DNA glycosylase [Candidatus Cloacimonetes bacterium]|nr:uracil-DNA glycosylase [Candidatus Cloacimonadota bacterium]